MSSTDSLDYVYASDYGNLVSETNDLCALL